MSLGFLPPRGPTLASALREGACQPVLPRSLASIITRHHDTLGTPFVHSTIKLHHGLSTQQVNCSWRGGRSPPERRLSALLARLLQQLLLLHALLLTRAHPTRRIAAQRPRSRLGRLGTPCSVVAEAEEANEEETCLRGGDDDDAAHCLRVVVCPTYPSKADARRRAGRVPWHGVAHRGFQDERYHGSVGGDDEAKHHNTHGGAEAVEVEAVGSGGDRRVSESTRYHASASRSYAKSPTRRASTTRAARRQHGARRRVATRREPSGDRLIPSPHARRGVLRASIS